MNVGISLSIVKDYISDNKSFLDTCKLLKEMGYSHLGYINFPFDLNRISKEVNEVKLPISLVMMPLEKVLNDTLKIMKDLKQIGCKNIGIESLSLDILSNEKRLKQALKNIDEIAKILNQNDIKLCYHFSLADFAKINKEIILDFIIENTKYLSFIFDPFYVQKGGLKIEDYLLMLKGRIEVVFLSDYQIIFDKNNVNICDSLVGFGNTNYKELLPYFKKMQNVYFMVNNSQTKNQFMKIKDTFDIIEKWK